MMNWCMLHKLLKLYMKFSKLGLLTLLISLFILNSCKNQENIGLDVDPSTQLNGTLIADTSVVSTTVREDSVIVNGLARSPLAYFKDPDFGITEANIATVLSIPTAPYTKPTGTITIDSVRLVLPYATSVLTTTSPTTGLPVTKTFPGFYGDSIASSFKLDVHQLNERINPATGYYNTKSWSYSSILLGTKTFYARASDSIRIDSIFKGRADSIIKVPPQLRVPIDPSFIRTNLFNATTSALSSKTIFENTVRGLYLTLDKSQTTGPGGNIFFNMNAATVKVYYKTTNGTTIDTTSVSLPMGVHVNEIKHTYSAKVQAALNNTSTDGLIYLQGLAGLRSKITLPDVKAIFAKEGGNVVINRAEIVVKAVPGTTTPYAPLRRLTMYQYDIAHQRIQLQDASATDPRKADKFGGDYMSKDGDYHFVITAYVQDLLRGKTVDYGTYIAPVDPTVTTGIDITSTAKFAERTIIAGKNSPNRIKLNIIYTKINQ
jgi:hypothetical protein